MWLTFLVWSMTHDIHLSQLSFDILLDKHFQYWDRNSSRSDFCTYFPGQQSQLVIYNLVFVPVSSLTIYLSLCNKHDFNYLIWCIAPFELGNMSIQPVTSLFLSFISCRLLPKDPSFRFFFLFHLYCYYRFRQPVDTRSSEPGSFSSSGYVGWHWFYLNFI